MQQHPPTPPVAISPATNACSSGSARIRRPVSSSLLRVVQRIQAVGSPDVFAPIGSPRASPPESLEQARSALKKRVVGRHEGVVVSEESGETLVMGHQGILVSFRSPHLRFEHDPLR